MSVVAGSNNSYAQIERLVRRYTASASESSLKSLDIQQQVNSFYNSDFPYSIKLDQMRSVYSFYTRPYIDRYPLDVNYNQGVRDPVYVDGIRGNLFKERTGFFNTWSRYPTLFKPISGDGVTATFAFTIPGPFLSGMVTLGGVAVGGNAISVADDGNGNLQIHEPNPVVSVPAQTAVYTSPPLTAGDPLIGRPVAGMKNLNTVNPGLDLVTTIGTVNYVTGQFALTFPAGYIPASGEQMRLRVSQYQTGRPYSVLFWNNEFTIRPIPKYIHKVEVEVYLTPVQFMLTTDSPILNQWVQYIAYGAAIEILRQRQDMAGVANLMEGFQRQEAMILERQGVEEIGQRNSTIYAGSPGAQQSGSNFGWNQGY